MADIEWFMIKRCQLNLGKPLFSIISRLVEDEKEANEMGTLESIKTKILIQVFQKKIRLKNIGRYRSPRMC